MAMSMRWNRMAVRGLGHVATLLYQRSVGGPQPVGLARKLYGRLNGVALSLILRFSDPIIVMRVGQRLLVMNASHRLPEFRASFLDTIHMPGSTLTIQQWLYHPLAATIPNPYIAALSYAILFVGVCYLPVLYLYRRKIFLKV